MARRWLVNRASGRLEGITDDDSVLTHPDYNIATIPANLHPMVGDTWESGMLTKPTVLPVDLRQGRQIQLARLLWQNYVANPALAGLASWAIVHASLTERVRFNVHDFAIQYMARAIASGANIDDDTRRGYIEREVALDGARLYVLRDIAAWWTNDPALVGPRAAVPAGQFVSTDSFTRLANPGSVGGTVRSTVTLLDLPTEGWPSLLTNLLAGRVRNAARP